MNDKEKIKLLETLIQKAFNIKPLDLERFLIIYKTFKRLNFNLASELDFKNLNKVIFYMYSSIIKFLKENTTDEEIINKIDNIEIYPDLFASISDSDALEDFIINVATNESINKALKTFYKEIAEE